MNLKWLTVPWSNRTKRVETVQLYEVRWMARYDEYFGNTRPEVEGFLSEAAAEEFARSLRNAFKLIRHSSGTRVEIIKGRSS
jgi:hypothetical protein